MTTTTIMTVELQGADGGAGLRNVAGRAARLVGLEDSDATRVATSVSELGRLAYRHLPASVTFEVSSATRTAPAVLSVVVRFDSAAAAEDLGPADSVRTAVARLMDQIDVGVDRVVISKVLPRDLDPEEVLDIRSQLLMAPASDLRSALQSQNEELLSTLVALREREADLVRLNLELEQTNRGVVALYAELEQRATEVRNAQRVVFEELEAALRPPAPRVRNLELGVRYLPAQANSPTGGDLYDWLVLPDGTLHVTVVDVLGHGVKSTRDALLVTHAVRTLILEGHLLGQIVARADALLQTATSAVVATALLAQIDPATGQLRLAGGGHPPALRVPLVGQPVYLEAPGRPVGYPEGGSDGVSTLQLDPGDVVLLYSDGLVEVRHDIVEGMETLVTAAAAASGRPLSGVLDKVLAACAQGNSLTDDTLLLAVRWHGPCAPR